MTNNRLFGLVGSIILFIGVFTPIYTNIFEDMDYFQNGKGDGVFIIILSLISLLLTIFRKYRGLLITGFLSLIIIFIDIKGLVSSKFGWHLLRWGWLLLLSGTFLIIIAAMVKVNKIKCPFCAELIKTEAKVCRYCGKELIN